MLRSVNHIICALALCAVACGLGSAPALAETSADELREQQAIARSVQTHWIARDFDLLDALAQEWRSKASRTSSGYWHLSLLYNHLDENLLARTAVLFPHGDDWRSVDRWLSDKPESPTPVILKALMLLRQAQDCYVPPRTARVRKVAPAFYRQMFVEAARELLEENRWAARDPHWHTAYLRALRFQGAHDDDLLLAHAQAMSEHPLYYQTHFEMFRDFALRWYPNIKMIDGFANTVLSGTRSFEGHMVYARLYQDAVIELNHGIMFVPPRAVWDRMRQGFTEITAAYPTDWNLNHFAFHACMAEDGAELRRLFAASKGAVVREAWQSPIIYKSCKKLSAP